MPTPVVMPQMGESIAEGTIVRWLKKVGDQVDRDEPLFEISTDKVDAEIPSPAAGVLAEITVREGETVAVNAVVATIAQPGEIDTAPAVTTPAAEGRAAAAASTQQQGDGQPAPREAAEPEVPGTPGAAPEPRRRPVPAPAAAAPAAGRSNGSSTMSVDELRRRKSSPLVRKIAAENQIDISTLQGSGIGGRVTKEDILAYIESGKAQAAKARDVGDRVEVVPMSIMRRKIAEHMVLSRRTSAHVHTVFHVNFSTVERLRRQHKAEYEARGAKLTYMAFIAKAVIDALRRHPTLNASIDGDNILLKKDINLGIAVALDDGLIVPVIKNADERNLLGLSRAIADVADRARARQLKPEEVQGGTFTITNPGQFGAQFGLPIINQPQVAILCVGTVEKRPVVIDDAIGIRTMAYLSLGFDHRLVDGAVADQFMYDVKQQIENFDPNQV